ncbi:DUF1902 domain-containing protein [Spirulina major CS-329]|uniref:DUF1902 domain-containing protein n=1 Tax=Spirulina TaxID=1154 RepID=UPI00232FFA78|nr:MULTISPECIES: DUF1902 domain-containing protein [Spirulina]MDB9495957.1 DUF1902 domain-containing protein [Spirulina subsalsa CS-330]MDB9502490.1 DUF1902 domain-containing protein [Spirulina major CS-329]
MQQLTCQIQAMWDSEARVWVATSDDVPGLATEADTLDILTLKLREMVPELLRLNAVLTDDPAHAISIVLNSHREDRIEVMA